MNVLYEHRSHERMKAYEVRRDRLREIKAELAGMLDHVKETGN